MPSARAAERSSGWSRRARMPPWTAGCRVLTRPSIISGKPVMSDTLVTARPASLRARAVPPVETISKPRATRPRPRSTMPVLSDTLSRALGIRTEVQYYQRDAGRAWRRKGKAAVVRPFFLVPTQYSVTARRKKNDAHHRQGQVVQQREGVRFHRARRRQRRLRPLLGHSGRWVPVARGRSGSGVRNR